MKLSSYAKKNSITYQTAHKHWKAGLISGKQLPTGTIVIDEEIVKKDNNIRTVLYARVSSSENKSNLDRQMQRLVDYASAKGYIITKEVKEIGSGLNDQRKQLTNIFDTNDWDCIIVEHKDRLCRFGSNYIKVLLNKLGKQLIVINETNNDVEDLMQDLVSIITSFCARLYGLRRSKRKTEKIIGELKAND